MSNSPTQSITDMLDWRQIWGSGNGTPYITPVVGAVCRCKTKAGLRRSPRDHHTRTRLSSLLRLNLDSSLKTTRFHSAAIQFPPARNHSKRRRRSVGVKDSTRNRRRDPKCPSAKCLRMVQEDTGPPNDGAICAWMAADEAVGCTRAFLTMWRSCRRLVCRRHPEPSLCVNDISRIHWSQHLLTPLSEWPKTISGNLIIVINGLKTIKDVLVNRADEFDGRPLQSNLIAWFSDGLERSRAICHLQLIYSLLFLLFPRIRAVEDGLKEVRQLTDNAVEEQIRTHDPSFSRGYVDSYLQYRNEKLAKGKAEAALFNDERLRANAFNIFFEGTESTSLQIISLLLELSKHPEAQRVAQEEMDAVIGRERLPSWLDKQNLPYVDATLQELYRLAMAFRTSTMYSNFDDFMRGRIIGKIEEGRKITDVDREFDIAHSVVSRLWKSFKTTEMCSRRHGEVVLKVRHLQKTDISSYQQKGTGAPQLIRWQISFLLPQESRSPEKLLPDV
ncbi:uncharacterized protein TNCV_130651 [Trichonephila clavipes]|nr:uncharacterized protein TNCV_130651 [Trichonephila clavipes]